MKPALYYALRKNLYRTVAAITSEKGPVGSPRRWHGRDVAHNEATHGRMDQLCGRFETLEQANACRAGIIAIGKEYDAKRKPLSEEVMRLHREEGDKIAAYIKEQSK